MAEPIELKVPEDYLNPGRPRLSLGQGLWPQFQFPQQLPAEPVAPLAPTSIEQRRGAMSGVDKFFAALQAMAAGLQGKPDPTLALHERQFERDQQRYLSEKGDYEQARRQFQQLKAQQERQTELIESQKSMAQERQKFEAELEKGKEKHAAALQKEQLASEEARANIEQWGAGLRSNNPAAVQASLAAIRANPAAAKTFGTLPDQAILDAAKALHAADTTLKEAHSRFYNMQANVERTKWEISTGARTATREQRQALGMPVDTLMDTLTYEEVVAMQKVNPAMATAITMARVSQSPLGMLTSFKLAEAFKKNPQADAGKIVDELLDQLKETSEVDKRIMAQTQAAYAAALNEVRGQPPDAAAAVHSIFRPLLAYYLKQLKITDVDVTKMGLTGKEALEQSLGKFIDEEAERAAAARRGRGGSLLPGLGVK